MYEVGFGRHFAEKFTAATDQTAMYVYGNVADTLRRAVSAPTTEFLGSFAGFARSGMTPR